LSSLIGELKSPVSYVAPTGLKTSRGHEHVNVDVFANRNVAGLRILIPTRIHFRVRGLDVLVEVDGFYRAMKSVHPRN